MRNEFEPMQRDGCECLTCYCDKPTGMWRGVYLCTLCRRGRHRRDKREEPDWTGHLREEPHDA